MPIRLIDGDETSERVIEGTTFVVKPISHGRLQEIRGQHTTGGVVDSDAVERQLWREHLVGWSDLYAGTSPLEFSAGEVERVIRSLAPHHVAILSNAIHSGRVMTEDALGN